MSPTHHHQPAHSPRGLAHSLTPTAPERAQSSGQIDGFASAYYTASHSSSANSQQYPLKFTCNPKLIRSFFFFFLLELGMEMEGSEFQSRVLQTLKCCQERKESPLIWAMEIAKWAVRVPSPELGEVLVSHLCFGNNHPSLWKFLHQALSSRLLSPLHVLSLLSARFIFFWDFAFSFTNSHFLCSLQWHWHCMLDN